jgi:hypothetical protein
MTEGILTSKTWMGNILRGEYKYENVSRKGTYVMNVFTAQSARTTNQCG